MLVNQVVKRLTSPPHPIISHFLSRALDQQFKYMYGHHLNLKPPPPPHKKKKKKKKKKKNNNNNKKKTKLLPNCFDYISTCMVFIYYSQKRTCWTQKHTHTLEEEAIQLEAQILNSMMTRN